MDINLVIQIAVYFAILIIIGSVMGRNKKREFSTTSKALTVSGLVAGFVMTHYGAGFILGGAELGYKNGLYGLTYALGAALGVFFLGFVIKDSVFLKNKAKKIKTIPSFLYLKYKDKFIANIAAYLSIFALITIASAQLFAISKILEILQLPTIVFPIVITFVIALVASKGLGTVIKFGKINLAIISLGLIVAFLIALASTSGISNYSESQGFEPLGWGAILAIILPTLIYTLIGQDFHQKVFSARNLRDVKISGITSGIILIILGAIPVFIGMLTKTLIAVEPAMAIPAFIISVLPSIFRSILIAAMLAAIIGSIQSVVSAAVSNIVEDVFPTFHISASKSQVGGLIASIIIPFIALGIAFYSNQGIVGILVLGYAVYVAGMFVPVIFGFQEKSGGRSSAARYSSIAGIIAFVILEFTRLDFVIPSIVFAVLISLAVFLACRYVKGENL